MAESKWYFTADQLINSPSKKCGIDADQELNYRQLAANLIQDMGRNVRVNQLCINTAIVYMHRFYAFHSFTHFHRDHIAAAALFLAAKVEEQPRKLELVIRSAYWCTHKDGPPFDPNSPQGVEQAQDLIFNENVLLQTLGFDVAIDHPHTHIVKACHLVRAHKDLAQTSYFMASNSLHMTTMCLQYKPTVVACFCIHLACKWSNWEIPQSNEGKPWFSYVDPTVNAKLLEQLTNDFLHIFDRCTSRLKRKILSIRDQSPSLGTTSPTNNTNTPFDKEPRKIEASNDNSAVSNIMTVPPSSDDFKPTHQASTSNDCFLTPALPPPPSSTVSTHGHQSSLSASSHSQMSTSFHNQSTHSNNLSHGHKTHHTSGASNQGNQAMSGSSKNISDARRISHKPTAGVAGHSGGVFSVPKPVSQRPDNKDLVTRKDHDKLQSAKPFTESNLTNGSQDERSLNISRQQRIGSDKVHLPVTKPSHSRYQRDSSTSSCSSNSSTLSSSRSDANTSQRHNASNYDEATNSKTHDARVDPSRQLKPDYQNKALQQKPNDIRHGDSRNGIVNARNEFKQFSKPLVPISGSYHKLKDPYYNETKVGPIPKSEIKQSSLNLDDLSRSGQSKNPTKTHRSSIFSPDSKEPLTYKKPKSPPKISVDKKLEIPKRIDNRPQETIATNQKTMYDKDARINNARKSNTLPGFTSLGNETIPPPISPFNSPPDNFTPRPATTTVKHRGRNSSSSSEPELVPMVKKIDETWGYENIMRDSKTRIKLNRVDTIQPLSTPNMIYGSKLPTVSESKPMSSQSFSVSNYTNKIETNPELVSSLLKESLYNPKSSIVSPLLNTSVAKTEPLAKMEIKNSIVDKQLNIGENSTKSVSVVKPNAESDEKDVDSNDSKMKSDKKKKKKEHKTKDRDRDREKRKKHKKDKERTKTRDDTTVSTTSVAGPSFLKITIPKDKINLSNTSGHRTQSGIKIKIPKERITDDTAPKISTTYKSAGVSDAGKPGLKIKISKEVIDSYQDPGKKRERDFSAGKSPPIKAPKVSKHQIINSKKEDNHKSSSSKVSDQSWDSRNNVDKTVIGKRDNKYSYNNDNRYGYERYDKKYLNKDQRARNFHMNNNNEYEKDRPYFNRNHPIIPPRVPDMNPYFYFPHTYPPPPINQFMYPHEMYPQPNPQFPPGPYYPHMYPNEAFYSAVVPPPLMGTSGPEVSPIIASVPAPPLPQGPPPEIPPPPPPPE